MEAYEAQSSQRLKDFKLAIEFKYLMKCAPGGVYLMPEIDNIRRLHGVIFVRRGLYRDGIFRFVMALPKAYNDYGAYPEITFTPPIFNPLVDAETGKFDLKADESLSEWQSEKHFILTALTFLKKIFYLKSYNGFTMIANPHAKSIFDSDLDQFMMIVSEEVKSSLRRIYEPQPPECTLIFTEPKPAHDTLRDKILGKAELEYQRKLVEEQRLSEEQGNKSSAVKSEYSELVNDDWGSTPSYEVGSRRYDRSNEAEDEADRLDAQREYHERRQAQTTVQFGVDES